MVFHLVVVSHDRLSIEGSTCIYLHKVAMTVHENGKKTAKETSMLTIVENEVLENFSRVSAGDTY